MIIRPGPVVDFLLANQNARDPYSLDWTKVTDNLFCFQVNLSSLASIVVEPLLLGSPV